MLNRSLRPAVVVVAALVSLVGAFVTATATPAMAAPPSNDAFADATPISGAGDLPGTGVDATREAGEPNAPCIGSATSANTVWFSLPAGSWQLQTSGDGIDTVLTVYTGTALADLQAVACNDDFAGPASRVTTTVPEGTTAYVQVGFYQVGAPVPGAPFTLSVTVDTPVERPPNDAFANATPVPGAGELSGTGVNATLEPGEPSPPCLSTGSISANTVWFALPPGTWDLETSGDAIDTVVAVYTGTALPDLEPVACNDDSGDGHASRLTATVPEGTIGYVQVGWYDAPDLPAQPAPFTLRVGVGTPVAPPANDDFTDAQPIVGPGDIAATGVGATVEPGEPEAPCRFPGSTTANTVWFALPAGGWRLTTSGDDIDTVMTVYAGATLSDLAPMGCDDDSGDGYASRLAVAVPEGSVGYLQVGWFATDEIPVRPAPYTLTVESVVIPANDRFAQAVDLPVGVPVDATAGAGTIEAGEPAPSCVADAADQPAVTLWYRLPDLDGAVSLDTSVSGGADTVLGVYTGTSLADLQEVGCNDNAGPGTADRSSHVEIDLSAGATYYAQVGYRGLSGGATQLTLLPAPTNDGPADAVDLAVPTSMATTGAGSTADPGVARPTCVGSDLQASVWFRLPVGAGGVRVWTSGGPRLDTILTAYRRTTDGDLRQVACSDDVDPDSGDLSSSLTVATGGTGAVLLQVGFIEDGRPFTIHTEPAESPADPSITGSVAKAPGTQLAYDFDVVAAGGGEDVTLDLPPSLVPVSAGGVGVTCGTETPLVCDVPPGSSQILLTVIPLAARPGPVTGTLEVGPVDVSAADNTAAVTAVSRIVCDRRGGSGADRLVGDATAEVLCGRGGDDVLDGRGGDDLLLGGAGRDRISYARARAGVRVDLRRQGVTDPVSWPIVSGTLAGGRDLAWKVEGVTGTDLDDVLIGDARANVLDGRAGDDRVDGQGGQDRCRGEVLAACES